MKGVFLSLISNLIRFHTMGGSFVYLSRLFVLHNTVSTQCLASFFSDCCLSLLPSSNKTLTFTKSSLFSPCLFIFGTWRLAGRWPVQKRTKQGFWFRETLLTPREKRRENHRYNIRDGNQEEGEPKKGVGHSRPRAEMRSWWFEKWWSISGRLFRRMDGRMHIIQ